MSNNDDAARPEDPQEIIETLRRYADRFNRVADWLEEQKTERPTALERARRRWGVAGMFAALTGGLGSALANLRVHGPMTAVAAAAGIGAALMVVWLLPDPTAPRPPAALPPATITASPSATPTVTVTMPRRPPTQPAPSPMNGPPETAPSPEPGSPGTEPGPPAAEPPAGDLPEEPADPAQPAPPATVPPPSPQACLVALRAGDVAQVRLLCSR
jgi:hypothetical protein